MKIKKIHKFINELRKKKPRINITTKDLLRRQVIILISTNNIPKFMSLSGEHISNINRILRNIKSEVMADFVHTDNQGLIIMTNKVISQSNLNTIENYIKNVDIINIEDIMTFHLPQSKSYLKIIGIPYIMEGSNVSINSSIVKSIIKSIYLTSKLYVIKALPKSNMVII